MSKTSLLETDPRFIRSFCMLAHVDHGKTTLSDYLLSSNAILAKGLAGSVRFLDSRPDEQVRLITMKASSVALTHVVNNKQHTAFLVDCPGHIDFSSEVAAAMRLCDSALVLVDVIDGVTAQTQNMLRQAFSEGLSICLVLNKMDLLITAQQLDAYSMYLRLNEIITNCNVTLSSFVSAARIAGDTSASFMKDIPDDEIWFSPSFGNVLFTSCLDGWACSLDQFVNIYSEKLKLPAENLRTGLWGEHYIVGGVVTNKPKKEGQMPLVVTNVFQPFVTLYEKFLAEDFADETGAQLTSKMGVPDSVWRVPGKDSRWKLRAVLAHWMPLAEVTLNTVCTRLFSPIDAMTHRMEKIINVDKTPAKVKSALLACSASSEITVAFIAKLSETELMAGTLATLSNTGVDTGFIGLGRVYSGEIRKGDTVTIHSGGETSTITVSGLYLLRGMGLEEVKVASAGCLFGVGGVANKVVKYATITNDPSMPEFIPPLLLSSSILRLSVTPKNPQDFTQLLQGLRLLYKVDAQVELSVLPTGEHLICCAGEVHAERCIVDLKERFAQVPFTVSEPIFSIRETIVGISMKPQVATVTTNDGCFSISMYALPVPVEAFEVMKYDRKLDCTMTSAKSVLAAAEAGNKKWAELLKKSLWAVGPMRAGYCGAFLFGPSDIESSEAEVLDGDVNSETMSVRSNESSSAYTSRLVRRFKDGICSGFQFACSAGPMAEEAMIGVAFFISNIEFKDVTKTNAQAYVSMSGQILGTVSSACRSAFQLQPQRVVEPIYNCIVFSSGNTQGKIYAALGKRRADILDEVLQEGSDMFHIQCYIPAAESFKLQTELRDATSGAASAYLQMSHWGVMEEDPYWVPTTAEELEDEGTKDKTDNKASTVLQQVRKRKGLHREFSIDAEKQKFSVRGA